MTDNPGQENFRVYLEGGYIDQGLERGAERAIEKIDAVERRWQIASQRFLKSANDAGLNGSQPFSNMAQYNQWERARFSNEGQVQAGLPQQVYNERQSAKFAADRLEETRRTNFVNASSDQRINHQAQEEDKRKDAAAAAGIGGGRSRDEQGRFVGGRVQQLGEQSFLMRMANNIGSTRMFSSAGSSMVGQEGPMARTMANAFGQALITSPTLRGAGSGLMGAVEGSLVNGGMLSRIPMGALGGGMSMGEAATAGVAGGGSGISGVLGALPAGAAAGAGAVAAGGLLAAALAFVGNAAAASQYKDEQNVRANVYNAGEGQGGYNLRSAGRQEAEHYGYNPGKDWQAPMAALGMAGVRANQMQGALSATFAMSRQTGMDPTQVASLTGTLMTQGGQSVAQLTKTFVQLRQAADDTGVPINKLVDSMTTLETSTGGAMVNVNGLSALQAMLGPAVNVGRMMTPLMGSSGIQSIAQAGMLGMNVGQFSAMQPHADQLYSHLATLARHEFGGNNNEYNRRALAGQLGGMGLLDLTGVPNQIQDRLMSGLLSGDPRKIASAGKQLDAYDKAHPFQGNQWEEAMAQYSGKEVSWLEQIYNKLNDLHTWFGELYRSIGQIGDILKPVGDALGAMNDAANALMNDLPVFLANAIKNMLASLINALHLPGVNLPTVNLDPSGNLGKVGDFLGNFGNNSIGISDAAKFKTVKNTTLQGLKVSNTRGNMDAVPPQVLAQVMAASKQTGVPAAVLLAQLARESDFQNSLEVPNQGVQGIHGHGIAQWDFSNTGNQRNAMHYLGTNNLAQAKKWAMDPARAIPAEAHYMADLAKEAGSWQGALGLYNGSQAYGAQTMKAALELQVHVNHDGSIAISHEPTVKAKVDTSRKPKGDRAKGKESTAQSHHNNWQRNPGGSPNW